MLTSLCGHQTVRSISAPAGGAQDRRKAQGAHTLSIAAECQSTLHMFTSATKEAAMSVLKLWPRSQAAELRGGNVAMAAWQDLLNNKITSLGISSLILFLSDFTQNWLFPHQFNLLLQVYLMDYS